VSFALDSSVALAWCFADEQTPVVMALLERVTEHGAFAPALWPLETANGLLMAERRGRVDAARRKRLVKLLQYLPITLDVETAARAWTDVLSMATKFSLTVYDACYLELAQRRSLPLATLDRSLHAAGNALGITVL